MNKELILAKLKENPYLTGKELSKLLNISIATANRYIKKNMLSINMSYLRIFLT